jgi:hypothetical protein
VLAVLEGAGACWSTQACVSLSPSFFVVGVVDTTGEGLAARLGKAASVLGGEGEVRTGGGKKKTPRSHV